MYNVSYVKNLMKQGFIGIPSWQSDISSHIETFGDSHVYNFSSNEEQSEWKKINLLARKSIQLNKKINQMSEDFTDVSNTQNNFKNM